jgi:hypothetical protein
MSEKRNTKAPKHENANFISIVVLIFATGALALAVIDENFRPNFAELAKLVIAGFIGWTMPK